MPTNKLRINVTLPDHTSAALEMIAVRDGVPTATKAAQLLQIGLEIEEDRVWDRVATTRDTKKAKFVSHKKAWGV